MHGLLWQILVKFTMIERVFKKQFEVITKLYWINNY
jgi:hypothetical protein